MPLLGSVQTELLATSLNERRQKIKHVSKLHVKQWISPCLRYEYILLISALGVLSGQHHATATYIWILFYYVGRKSSKYAQFKGQ